MFNWLHVGTCLGCLGGCTGRGVYSRAIGIEDLVCFFVCPVYLGDIAHREPNTP